MSQDVTHLIQLWGEFVTGLNHVKNALDDENSTVNSYFLNAVLDNMQNLQQHIEAEQNIRLCNRKLCPCWEYLFKLFCYL